MQIIFSDIETKQIVPRETSLRYFISGGFQVIYILPVDDNARGIAAQICFT